jgi:hypothetical protein
VRLRLALIATLAAACFPATALADDAPAPADAQPAPAADTQPAAPSCLQANGGAAGDLSIRGVRVGARASIRDADGRPLAANSVTYCVDGGGEFRYALSSEQDVLLVLSTANGDSIGLINPTSPAESARTRFPKMKRLTRAGATTVYRVDARRQLILGVAAGRVSFVAAADRLLLEYPNKLGYYMRRLGF